MNEDRERTTDPYLFFTAPWEPVPVRRGDALGLRALTDRYADVVAPGLSNRTNDGRWVTILSWCLVRSHQAFRRSGGGGVRTRREQLDRYSWLRPLELMWVARTITIMGDDRTLRPLAGQRSVRRWIEKDRKKTDYFGLIRARYDAYRHTGMYGAYRMAFRRWPGMTVRGDGWTPDRGTLELAMWLDKKLGNPLPELPIEATEEVSVRGRKINLSKSEPDDWWLRKWRGYDEGSRSAERFTLPRPWDEHVELPEASLLRPRIFGDGRACRRRLQVAQEVARSGARNHLEICRHLARTFPDHPYFQTLPAFSRLADAGTEAMRLIFDAMQADVRRPIDDIAGLPRTGEICDELNAAAAEWMSFGELPIAGLEVAHRLADAVAKPNPADCLSGLLRHHELRGGGLRWFVLRGGIVEPRTAMRSGSSWYRFRLAALCRLAAQCGMIDEVPEGLSWMQSAEDRELADDESEEDDE